MKSLARQSLYEILDLEPAATAGDIELACERALALYGPGSLAAYTLVSDEEAALMLSRIEEARQVLLDPAARARYDATLGVPQPAAPAPEASAPIPLVAPVEVGGSAAPAGRDAPAEGGGEAAGEVRPAPALEEVRSPPVVLLSQAVEAGGPPERAADPAPQAPIPLRVEVRRPPAQEREVVVPEGTSWTGDVLRKVREARGLSVETVCERTKVARHHLENIEADRFGMLPAPVYLRGILAALARELRLDGQKVSRSYVERMQAASPQPSPPPRAR